MNRNAILLVEDEALIALSEAQILERYGYEVTTARNGEEAVDRFRADNAFDLVLMDIDLGTGIDGTEAARRMLAHREVPIVFLTSHAEREMVDRVKGITRYGYVLKNAGDFVLVEAISTAFDLFEAHQQANETSRRLRDLIDATRDIICFKDGEGRWLEANAADLELFELTGVDYRGRTDRELAEYTHECFREAFLTCLESDEAAWRAGAASSGIETITGPDGSRHVYDIVKIPTFEHDGRRKGLIVYGRDITELAELRAHVESLTGGHDDSLEMKLLLDEIGYAVIATDVEGTITYWNRVAERLYGWRAAEVVGRPILEVTPIPELRDQAAEIMAKIAAGERWHGEFTVRRRDGRVIPVIVTDSPVIDHEGNLVGVIGVSYDISERKRAEEELAESERHLAESQRVAKVGHYLFNTTAGRWQPSEQLREILGIDEEYPDDVEGWLSIVHPDDRDRLRRYQASLESATDREIDIEYRIVDQKTGAVKWVHARGHVSRSEVQGSDIRGPVDRDARIFFGTIQDISDRKEIEADLRQALRDKDDLMKELNHRVKNNLAMVSSLISLKNDAVGEALDLSDLRNQIEAIRVAHEALSEMPGFRTIDLGAYLERILSAVVSPVPGVRYRFSPVQTDLPAKPAITIGLILNEIATNAVKHALLPDHEVEISVACSLDIEAKTFVLTVENDGRPFPADAGFENPSTLGLRLINALVMQLNGRIELRREPTTGFTITVPVD